MPVFFQQQINETTRLGVWKIEETEEFFKGNVPVHRNVTHPHKRLQHLAGRFLLQFLFPDFPYKLIQVADTRKPFLMDEQYHFSISHCGDYAAAIVSRKQRVGIDVELVTEKISRIKDKYLHEDEQVLFGITETTLDLQLLTVLWSAKESVFKWYGNGNVDFKKHIQLFNARKEKQTIDCFFSKSESELVIHYREFNELKIAWVFN
ncbi:MAG TPA: 4'-phosphopantetheinyl transferase superfamily protein [Chitinophagaceae bacterium]|nr:4'-phosphopantetheinyl transferase superfamily protein [Chitinophagaceae bacterium]HNU15879.1 4'-phosphopantetheinyl transferase superfamily protein [Chitinophagaceae bacterium]